MQICVVKKNAIGARLTGWTIVDSGGCVMISMWSVTALSDNTRVGMDAPASIQLRT